MTQEQKVAPTKDELRAKIFSAENSKCKRVEITFNGAKLELQQPTITEVMELNDRPEASARVAVMLIKHAYVPNTDVHVFDDTDYDVLAALPYSPELTVIQEHMNVFLIGDDKAAEKN